MCALKVMQEHLTDVLCPHVNYAMNVSIVESIDMYRIFFSTIFNHIDWFALKSLQRGSETMFYQVTFFVVDNLWVVITEEPQS